MGRNYRLHLSQMVVAMILNKVATSSVDGGQLSAENLKRNKAEFILLANSKRDCQKVVSTFNSIFKKNADENVKNKYDIKVLTAQSAEDKKLATAVSKHIEEAKSERISHLRRALTINTILQNQMQNSSGFIERSRH